MNENSRKEKGWPPVWLPFIAIIAVGILWPIAGIGAHNAWLSSRNRIEDWLPDSFPETKALHRFSERFGSDEFLMISWEGCVFGSPVADEVAASLLSPATDGITYFAKADTAKSATDSLRATREITESIAIKRLKGVFVGNDGKQSCVVALISESGQKDRPGAIKRAWDVAQLVTRLPKDQIHIAGTTADSVAVDEASAENLLWLNLASYCVCFFILVASLRKFWLVGTLFLCAIFNQHLALAFIYYSGGHVDSVQLLVANLSFVLTISAGLHFLGYFREACVHDSRHPALVAIRLSFIPSALAALTTSLGFASLCNSELVPIRSFGFYSAILVPINTLIVVILLSVHGKWASQRAWNWRQIPLVESHNSGHHDPSLPLNQHPNFFIRTFIPVVKRAPLTFIVLWLIAMFGFAWGVTKLTTSVGTKKLLSENAKLVRDYAWLEERIGPLVPLEIVIQYAGSPEFTNAQSLERLKTLDELRDLLSDVPEIQSTFSVLNFLPPLPTALGARPTTQRNVIAKKANDAREEFKKMGFLYEDSHEQSWRISGRVPGSTNVEYSALLSNLQTKVNEFKKQDKTGIVNIEIGGGVPFVYRTQRQLLQDLLSSFTSAFISIAVSMAILFRSVLGGILTMIPNVTPAAVVFGIMGYTGLEVEIGTVLTASVMMGVCVDDTLHFVSHFRMLRKKGKTPEQAVNEALANCGDAMLQTALVCGVGMLVFAASPFVPVARFAWLTFTLLIVGLISDIVLTPAMLLSPLHHMFYWEWSKKRAATTDTANESK